jgi:deazaflavin-dependent oxidoreductase (nitroreductase family)
MDRYEIRVAGQLDQRRVRSLGGEELRLLPGGDSLLSFVAVDQAALYGLLTPQRDAGLELISADRVRLSTAPVNGGGEANAPQKEPPMSPTEDQIPQLETRPRPYVPSRFFMSRVVNPITLWLGGPTLTVRGRRSGRPIRTPVPTLEVEGARYLVSGGGETHWVRNLRAAGQGELRRGRTHEPFRAVEVGGDEHDRVVTAYREHMGWRAREFFTALPDPADHPVFRVEPQEA